MIEYLKECNKPKSRLQIAKALKSDPIRISKILKVLVRWNEVKFIEYDRDEASQMVNYKLLRRTRFYFLEGN